MHLETSSRAVRSRRNYARVLVTVAALGLALSAAAPANAAAPAYAPPDRPGPALTVPAGALEGSLVCSGDFAGSTLEPVLLNPATGVNAEQNYSWNYERAFTAEGRPWCAVTVPYRSLGDIQIASEYIVHAIRTTYAKAQRPIAVLGHSQGGMSMRWPLRFWPDTRPMVTDVIGMAASNHGTTVPNLKLNCQSGVTRCPPAVWQQKDDAQFIRALNSSAETWSGISYTEIVTRNDEVVQPSNDAETSSSALHTGNGDVTNVAVQDICPTDTSEHLQIGTTDPVAYALVQDALGHSGPADVDRVRTGDPTLCTQQYQPGVDPTNAQTYLQTLAAGPGLLAVSAPGGINVVGAPEVSEEPPLRCYVFAAGCPTTAPSVPAAGGPSSSGGIPGTPARSKAETTTSSGVADSSMVAAPATPVLGTPNFAG